MDYFLNYLINYTGQQKKNRNLLKHKIEYENDQKSLPVNIIESMGPLYSGIY